MKPRPGRIALIPASEAAASETAAKGRTALMPAGETAAQGRINLMPLSETTCRGLFFAGVDILPLFAAIIRGILETPHGLKA